MKFIDGYMIKTGAAAEDYVDKAVRHVLMRQGVLGRAGEDHAAAGPDGQDGPEAPLSDIVQILEPKEELPVAQPAYDDAMNKRVAAHGGLAVPQQPQRAAPPGVAPSL